MVTIICEFSLWVISVGSFFLIDGIAISLVPLDADAADKQQ